MKERLDKLKQLIEELKGDSYGDQYGICDIEHLKPELNKLAKESAFYQRTLDEIDKILTGKPGKDLNTALSESKLISESTPYTCKKCKSEIGIEHEGFCPKCGNVE